MRNRIYLLAILIALSFSQDISLEGVSGLFSIDTIEPEVSITSQNAGGNFMGDQPIRITWEASDNSPSDNPIDIYLKIDQGTQTISVLQGAPDTGFADIIMPEVTTQFGQFYIEYTDAYGYSNSDSNDSYFTVGDVDDNSFENTEISLEGASGLFRIDTKEPEISVTSQNAGGSFVGEQPIRITWEASDNSPSDNPIDIYLKIDQGAQTTAILVGAPDTGFADINMPNLPTIYGQFYIQYTDQYGFQSSDYNNEYFSIGDVDDNPFENTEITLEGFSQPFIVDTKDPEFLPINDVTGVYFYPNGEELIENYESVLLEWNATDDSFDNGSLKVSLAYLLGGWYQEVLNANPSFSSSYVDLSNIEATIWARLKFSLTDDYGNVSDRYNDDYFILGNPEGDMSVNSLDEDDNTYVLEWGWRDNHLVVINPQALTSFSEGDIISVTDQEGISSYDCEGAIGPVELATYTVTGQEIDPIAIMLNSGYNYCNEGGDISLGYIPHNLISFSVFDASENSNYMLLAEAVSIDEQCVFDNQSTLIYGFTQTQFIGSGNNSRRDRGLVSLNQKFRSSDASVFDDREIDIYNIYRSTNASNLRRDYELIEGAVSQTYYFDTYSSLDETINQTICYRVWLLNSQSEEILKTVDSCTNYYADYMAGDVNQDGSINVLDVVAMVSHIVGSGASLSEEQLIYADYNLDGFINILDVVAVVNVVLNG